jgi:hypothetical protein
MKIGYVMLLMLGYFPPLCVLRASVVNKLITWATHFNVPCSFSPIWGGKLLTRVALRFGLF